MATAETIREAKRSEPFRPFRLRLIDGTEYEVTHPDFISVPPAPRAREVLFYMTADEGKENERRWIDGDDLRSHHPPLGTVPPRPGSEANGPD